MYTKQWKAGARLAVLVILSAALAVTLSGLLSAKDTPTIAATSEATEISAAAPETAEVLSATPEAAGIALPPDAEGILTPEEFQAGAGTPPVAGTPGDAAPDDEAPENTPPGAGTPGDAPRSKAEILLESMSVREKVCQLFIVFPEQLTGKAPVTVAGDAMREGLARYPVGGVIFDRDSMKSAEQLRALLRDAQSMSRIRLLMTCDEEGGRVNRLMATVGTPYVGPMLSYRDKGPETATSNAVKIAGSLLSYGFNMDLAPVADVWSNPDNKVIGNRAYSTDFQEAAELVAAAVRGFHTGGAACTLKHFPGHGNTYEDSHNGLAKVYRTREQLEAWEWKPFRAGIAAGADAVMIGHLIAGEIDSKPATFSSVIVTDILRKDLGFTGVIMTDSLQMDAVSKNYTPGEAALYALEAGVDALLCPDDLSWATQAILYALETGRVTEARINESALRILQLKETYGLLD